MTPQTSRRPARRGAWLVGSLVLLALVAAVTVMLLRARRPWVRTEPSTPAVATASEPAAVPSLPLDGAAKVPQSGVDLRGVVRVPFAGAPGSVPLTGATVSLHRATTAWPEWRSERAEQVAVTQGDGSFRFRVEAPHGLYVRCEHPQFATMVAEVPHDGSQLDLVMTPGFDLLGFVTNADRAPVANARVALESVPGEQRRVVVAVTGPDGRYRFRNVAAGPVRVVARHPSWQPIAEPAFVVGESPRLDLAFVRPAMAPLRGRVLAAATQAPIAGATIELLPPNQKLGLVDGIGAQSAADGTFLLTGLARGNMRMVVRHPEYGAVLRTQQVGIATDEVLVELPPRTLVQGVLATDGDASLLRGGEVLELRDSAGLIHYVAVAADGRFRCDAPLSPGALTVRAFGGRFGFANSFSNETGVTLEEAPRNDLELPLRKPTVVRGRLVDGAGRPVAGAALVRTRMLSTRSIGDAARQFDREALLTQFAQLFGSDRDEVLGRSGADGTFELLGQKPGSLLLRIDARGYGRRMLRVDVGSDRAPTELGDVALARGGSVGGVVSRGTTVLAGVVVTVDGTDAFASTITDRSGGWLVEDLVPGTYRVRAKLPNGAAEGDVLVRGDGARANLGLRLGAGRSVRGIVRGSDGQPLAGALVGERGASGRTTATDANGEFVLELPARAVELPVELQASLLDRSLQRIVRVPAGVDRDVEITLATPPTCTIVARIAGLPGRKELRSGLLRLARIDDDEEVDRTSRWIEFPDGALRWPLCPVGRVRIEIWCEGHAPCVVERETEVGQVVDLGELLLEPGCRLAGVVRDAQGAPVPNAVVMLGEEGDLQLFEGSNRTAADGSFRLRGVTNRSASLVVRAAGYAPSVVSLQLPDDLLAPTPYELRLSRGATIRAEVPRQIARDGGFVQLLRDGRVLATTEVDELGRAEFVNRAVGSYRVRLLGSEAPPKPVEVEAAAELVRVQLP